MNRRAIGTSLKFILVVVLAAALIAGALAIKQWALQSDRRAQQEEILVDRASMSPAELAKEEALAEAYWRRYPDVAADDFFGRDGNLGVHGPRVHYERHGRAEGREWPATP